MAAAKQEAVLFAISVFNWVFTSVIQSPRFTNDYEIGINVIHISSRHSNLNFAHHAPFCYLLIVPKWRE